MKKGIPFSLSLSKSIATLDEMDNAAFNDVMEKGLKQAKNGESHGAEDVFSSIRKEITNG